MFTTKLAKQFLRKNWRFILFSNGIVLRLRSSNIFHEINMPISNKKQIYANYINHLNDMNLKERNLDNREKK